MSNKTTAFDEDFIQRADASIIYFDSNDEVTGYLASCVERK